MEDSNEEPNEEPNDEGSREESAVEEGVEEGEEEESKEEEEEEDSKEEEEKKKGRSAKKRTSEGPTDKEVKKWIEENQFICDEQGCDRGKGGRPYRHKTMGGVNLHRYNAHGKGTKKKEGEEEKGEGDMVNEAIKRKEAAELKGKLTQTINRIIKLGAKQKEVLEPENSILKEWKRRCLQEKCAEEEIAFMQDELSSIILTIDELEKESKDAKADKKAKAEKKTKSEEEDDDDDLLGYTDMKSELKTIRVRSAIDEAREERETARRRRDREDERREEEHQMRMQAMKGGGGPFSTMGNPQMGGGVIEEVIFKYDEEGNLLRDADGQPIAASIRRTPVNALALQGQGRGDGKNGDLKMVKTIFDMAKGDTQEKAAELKMMKEQNIALITEIRNMAEGTRDKNIWGGMGELKKDLNEIAAKMNKDPMEEYITMQDRLKEHNIYADGSSSPEVKRIDLEIEREKTRRSMDLMMMNKTFGIAEKAIIRLSDGPLAKAAAKKIDQSDIIKPEEEELPPDEEFEAEIDAELEQPEPPPPEPSTKKKEGKHGRGKR